MLILKFTCDENHHLNSDLIADKFAKAIESKDIHIKKSPDMVKIYLGKKNSDNMSLSIEVTEDDIDGCIMKED